MGKNVKDDNNEFSSRKSLRKDKNRPKVIIASVLGIVIAAFVAFIIAGMFMINNNTVADGVYVGNTELGGLSLDEAKEKLSDFSEPYTINISANKKSYELNSTELSGVLDADATAKKAFSYGKDGNFFSRIFKAMGLKFKKFQLLPVFSSFDNDILAEKISNIGEDAYKMVVEHTASVENDNIILIPGTTGYDGNPDSAISEFENSLKSQYENLITLNFSTKAPDTFTLEKLHEILSTQVLEATFKIENGEVVVTEAKPGYSFDESEAIAAIAMLKEGGEMVKFPCVPKPPEFSEEELKAKLFNSELASYSTRYNQGQANRSANVANAASRINGKILLPGEIFSFNETVGKRTVANGFKPAPEYVNGQSVTGIGGGTCQVSTTLYSAVLYANLQVVSRRNHSMSVAYVPLGQDATVTDGGIDFKFKNNTAYPVKIKASAGGGKITVTIIGTASEPKQTVKVINTKTSPLSATTTRIVYDADGNELYRENMGTSKYKPHESETVATPSPAPSESPQPSEEPSETTAPEKTEKPEVTDTPENVPTINETNKPEETEAPKQTPTPKASPKPTEKAETTPVSAEIQEKAE